MRKGFDTPLAENHPNPVSAERPQAQVAVWLLENCADQRNESVNQLVARIDQERKFANLSSNLRLFVLEYYQDQYNSGKLVDFASEDATPVA